MSLFLSVQKYLRVNLKQYWHNKLCASGTSRIIIPPAPFMNKTDSDQELFRVAVHRERGQVLQSSICGFAIPDPIVFNRLGSEECLRQQSYRELFRYHLDLGIIDEIRSATNGNFALGSDIFKEQSSAALGRRVQPAMPGRPRKQD